MNEDINTTGAAGNINPSQDEKTFSQEDVNRIVSERLSREKQKLESAVAEREQQLAHREFLLEAKETLQGKGLPLALLDALNTTSKEAFEKSLAILEETKRSTPPPYASGTGKDKILFANEPDAVREAMGLQRKD